MNIMSLLLSLVGFMFASSMVIPEKAAPVVTRTSLRATASFCAVGFYAIV